MGKTKVFFRRRALELLESARARVMEALVITIQASGRGITLGETILRIRGSHPSRNPGTGGWYVAYLRVSAGGRHSVPEFLLY